MIEWKDGDIYERHIDGGPPIYKVIVKKNRRSAVVLRIYEVPQIEHNFAVNVRGKGYVGAGYLYVESASTLNEAQLVRSMTDEEYGSLLIAVAGALGIEAKADPEASAGGGGTPVLQEVSAAVEPIRAEAGELIVQPSAGTAELIAGLRAERDVYKELVYRLLDGDAGRKA